MIIDGHAEYSKILFVKSAESGAFTIATNLVQSKLTVLVNTDQPEAGSIIIYDFSGRQVLKLKGHAGNQDIYISSLSCGR